MIPHIFPLSLFGILMVALGRGLFRLFFPDQPVQGLDASTEDAFLFTDFLIEKGEEAQPELP